MVNLPFAEGISFFLANKQELTGHLNGRTAGEVAAPEITGLTPKMLGVPSK